MKKLLILLLIACPLSFVYAQDNTTPKVDTNMIFTFVQMKPSFKGDLYKYIADNIVYPKDAIDKNITGTVYITFVVERDGSLSGVKVIRGVYASLDDEAVRVMQRMPKWTPGTQNGHNVRVQYNIPIRFELRDNNKGNQDNNSKDGSRRNSQFH
ncbi:MAG TPA: energy transducer TonB [Bacteroidia bacterium]|jgi:TonB family protein|nr:energy transducer TonB [Bacteroidia bacterium]